MKKLLLVIGVVALGSFMKAESLDDSLDYLSVSLEISFYSQVFVTTID